MTDKVELTVKVDTAICQQANELFKAIGLDMDTAINMFLKQCVREQGLPFKPSLVNSQEANMVTMSKKDYDAIQETIRLLSNNYVMDKVHQGDKQFDNDRH